MSDGRWFYQQQWRQQVLDNWDRVDRAAEEELQYEGATDEVSLSEYCVTCGREWGTALRDDGQYYCAECWTVWNS